MSLVSAFTRSPRTTLVVTIGIRYIACAAMVGTAARGPSCAESQQRLPIDTANVETALQALVTALQQLYAAPVAPPSVQEIRVVIADGWLPCATIPWHARLRRPNTAIPYVRSQLASNGFELAPADVVMLDDAAYGQPRMAYAYPAALLAALEQLAQRLGTRLASVLPLSAVAWHATRQIPWLRAPVLSVLDDGVMLFLHGAPGMRARLREVNVRLDSHNADFDHRAIEQAWQRLVLREPRLAAQGQLAVLDLTGKLVAHAPETSLLQPLSLPSTPSEEGASALPLGLQLAAFAKGAVNAVDVVMRSSAMSPTRWLALVGAAVLAGAIVLDAVQSYQAVQALNARLEATAQPTAVAPVRQWARDELPRVQAVNMAIRELNLPISALLRALQPPQDIRVAVLSVETAVASTTGQASGIKIHGEARTGADMARYVAFLSERKPFTGAYLTRHEIDDTVPERPYRFSVEALWND